MFSNEVLRLEAGQYRLLSDQLRHDFGAIDDETLKNTLEGLSQLPEMIEEIVRSSLEDDAMILGLKSRLDAMNERLSRFKDRYEKKRKLVALAMGSARIDRLDGVEFSVCLSLRHMCLEVEETAKIPPAYLVPQPPKLDRAGLTAALKRGETIEGARLAPSDAYITVRTR